MNADGDTALKDAIKHRSLLTVSMLINCLSDEEFLTVCPSLTQRAQVSVFLLITDEEIMLLRRFVCMFVCAPKFWADLDFLGR